MHKLWLIGLVATASQIGCVVPPAGERQTSSSAMHDHRGQQPLTTGWYRISAVEVTLRGLKPDGKGWDIGSGAPDPIVELRINGQLVGVCSSDDTYAPNCGPFFVGKRVYVDIGFLKSNPISISVEDKDIAADDYVGSAHIDDRSMMHTDTPIELVTEGALMSASITLTPSPAQ